MRICYSNLMLLMYLSALDTKHYKLAENIGTIFIFDYIVCDNLGAIFNIL